MFRKVASALLVLAFAAPSGGADLAAQEATFEWSRGMGQGQVLEVRGIVGSIRG